MLLEIKNVKASYGLVPAIHEANFFAEHGEVVGILGHNGMGKTTLLKTIMGFVKQNSGEINFDGETINKLSVHQRASKGIGLIAPPVKEKAALSGLFFGWGKIFIQELRSLLVVLSGQL